MGLRTKQLCALLLLGLIGAADVPALTPKQKLELTYAQGLMDLQLPAYAETVAKKAGLSGPEYKALICDIHIRKGEFDKVLGLIKKERNQESLETWAMRLTLADGYFAWGKYAKAEEIYVRFFAKYKDGPPKEISSFFFESAYKFAQMKLLQKDKEGAIVAYKSALLAKPPRHIERQIQADLAELMLTVAESSGPQTRAKFIKEVDVLADKLLWVQDLWFGKALVMKAHILFLKDDIEGAMDLLDDYKKTLKDIDEQLKSQSTPQEDLSALSPMAQVRFLLGKMLLDEAKEIIASGSNRKKAESLLKGIPAPPGGKSKPGAVQHFLNVFMRYSNTQWAADAGKYFEEAKKILEEEFRREVNFEATPEQWAKVEAAQFEAAKLAYNQQQYEEAAGKYIKALERFSTSKIAVGALSDLVNCYIELDNDLYADMVVLHLAERYNKRPNESQTAGNTVLHIATKFSELGRQGKRDEVYEVFFDNFDKHPMTPRLLFSAGERRFADSEFEAAVEYYQRVVDQYAGSPISYDAMGKIAACHAKAGNSVEEIKALKAQIERLIADKRLGHNLIRALYRLGNAFRKVDKKYYPAAIKRYKDVITRLESEPDKYQRSKEESDKNQDVLEASLYFKSYCFAKVAPPKGKPENAFKKLALKGFIELAEKYPESKMAPQAMSQAGTLWTIIGNASEAQLVFSKLKRNYPNSPEAKNVDFLLGMSLLDLGMRKQAIKVFGEMFASGGKYSEGQILTAGRELLNAGEYKIAVTAFDRVLSTATERKSIEPALGGKGRALVGNEQYAIGAATLEELFTKYPRTALTIDAAFDLSRAYARIAAEEADEIKRATTFNNSVTAMKKVLTYDPSRRAEASVEVGRIQELKARSEEKFGSKEDAVAMLDEAIGTYQTIILLENPDDSAVRPFLEQAYRECTRLFIETKRWQDAFDDSNTYLEHFKDSKHALDIRSMRSRARAQLTISQPGGTAEDAPDGEGEDEPDDAVTTAAAPAP